MGLTILIAGDCPSLNIPVKAITTVCTKISKGCGLTTHLKKKLNIPSVKKRETEKY